jgi:hypothetical protein
MAKAKPHCPAISSAVLTQFAHTPITLLGPKTAPGAVQIVRHDRTALVEPAEGLDPPSNPSNPARAGSGSREIGTGLGFVPAPYDY